MNKVLFVCFFIHKVFAIDTVDDISLDFTKIRFDETLNKFTSKYGRNYTIEKEHTISPCAGFIKVSSLDHVVDMDPKKDLLIFSTGDSETKKVVSMKPFNTLDIEQNNIEYNSNVFSASMYLPLNRITNCDEITSGKTIYVDHYRTNSSDPWSYQDLGNLTWSGSNGHEDVTWSPTRTVHSLTWNKESNANAGFAEEAGTATIVNVNIGDVILFEGRKDEENLVYTPIRIRSGACSYDPTNGNVFTDHDVFDPNSDSDVITDTYDGTKEDYKQVFVIQDGQQTGSNVEIKDGQSFCIYNRRDSPGNVQILRTLVVGTVPPPPQPPAEPPPPPPPPPPAEARETINWDLGTAQEKNMNVGDKLVFKYSNIHNVILVDESIYNPDSTSPPSPSCFTQLSDASLANKWDKISGEGSPFDGDSAGEGDGFEYTLNTPGTFYFVCGPHCSSMKLKVTVSAPPSSPTFTITSNGVNPGDGSIARSYFTPLLSSTISCTQFVSFMTPTPVSIQIVNLRSGGGSCTVDSGSVVTNGAIQFNPHESMYIDYLSSATNYEFASPTGSVTQPTITSNGVNPGDGSIARSYITLPLNTAITCTQLVNLMIPTPVSIQIVNLRSGGGSCTVDSSSAVTNGAIEFRPQESIYIDYTGGSAIDYTVTLDSNFYTNI